MPLVRKTFIEKLNKTVKLKIKTTQTRWRDFRLDCFRPSPFLNVKVKVSEVKRFACECSEKNCISSISKNVFSLLKNTDRTKSVPKWSINICLHPLKCKPEGRIHTLVISAVLNCTSTQCPLPGANYKIEQLTLDLLLLLTSIHAELSWSHTTPKCTNHYLVKPSESLT